MPGSAYHQIAEYIAECLSVVPECNINASTKEICDRIRNVTLEEGEEMVSFDVVSLYTNVPLREAILVCADLLYSQSEDKIPAIRKDTFILLAELSSCNVIMSTHDGIYYQKGWISYGQSTSPYVS